MSYCTDCGTEVQSGSGFCQECGTEIESTQESATKLPEPDHPGEDGFAVKHALIVSGLALIPAAILGIIAPGDLAVVGLLIGIPLFAYLGYQKPTTKSAFSRQSFWSAIMLLLSPLMMIVHTAVFIESETDGAAEEAGAAIGGTVLIVLAFLIGLPLAGVFYLAHKKTKLPNS
jgi:hypothetical protein